MPAWKRQTLFILHIILAHISFSQNIKDKYLHYRTDYYWDTTLYKSEKDFYYHISNGEIVEKKYPVLRHLFTQVVNENPLQLKDSFYIDKVEYPSYKYVKKKNCIYVEFFNHYKHKKRQYKQYSLNSADSIPLMDKNSIDDAQGITLRGYSIFQGTEKIMLRDTQYNTLKFLEIHDNLNSHPSYYTTVVFLEINSLIPVKFIYTSYNPQTKQKAYYRHETLLNASGTILHDYSALKAKDLVLFENKSTTWTEQQKKQFMQKFLPKEKEFGECLLKMLDGNISFYGHERNEYFRSMVINKKCEEYLH